MGENADLRVEDEGQPCENTRNPLLSSPTGTLCLDSWHRDARPVKSVERCTQLYL